MKNKKLFVFQQYDINRKGKIQICWLYQTVQSKAKEKRYKVKEYIGFYVEVTQEISLDTTINKKGKGLLF